jgi:hypothetical protein
MVIPEWVFSRDVRNAIFGRNRTMDFTVLRGGAYLAQRIEASRRLIGGGKQTGTAIG